MASGSVQPLIQCLTIDINGVAITSADSGGYYAYEINSGIAAPSGFKFLCASPTGGQWNTGVNLVNVYEKSGYLVYSATALQSITINHSRPFNIFYITQQ